MKRTTLLTSLSFVMIVVIFTNCGKREETTESPDDNAAASTTEEPSADAATKPQFEVDTKFQEQLAVVFTSYVALKDAFVQSDPAKVKEKAGVVNESLTKADMKLLNGAAHNDWMTYLTPIQNSLKEILASSDIGAQRKAFSSLSDNLYKSIKAFGLGGKEAFYEYCPMAFDNTGAYWLSDVDQVRNPYFGDEMLTCGVVKEKLK